MPPDNELVDEALPIVVIPVPLVRILILAFILPPLPILIAPVLDEPLPIPIVPLLDVSLYNEALVPVVEDWIVFVITELRVDIPALNVLVILINDADIVEPINWIVDKLPPILIAFATPEEPTVIVPLLEPSLYIETAVPIAEPVIVFVTTDVELKLPVDGLYVNGVVVISANNDWFELPATNVG